MKYTLTQEQIEILDDFYQKLVQIVNGHEKRIEYQSILTKLMQIPSNKSSQYLNESSFKSFVFPKDDLVVLEKHKLIRNSEYDVDSYLLTAHGIWDCENRYNKIDEYSLVEFIENQYFSKSGAQKKLSPWDKVVLLSMLGVRTFSKECSMDLENQKVMDGWWNIFGKSIDYLKSKKVIPRKKLKVGKPGNQHYTSYIMSRRNELPKTTKHIYKILGNRKYYLDIENKEEKISQEKLKYIIKSIVKNFDEYSECEDLYQFLTELAYNDAKYVSNSLKFIAPDYDYVIKDSIKETYLG